MEQGTVIGSYSIVRPLGRGGMGSVHAAEHIETKEPVALKILLEQEAASNLQVEQARRLRDEATAASKVQHPAILKVLDSGDDSSYGPYVVYQLLSGRTLRDELREGRRFASDELLDRLLRPILGGLVELHGAGIVHRDIKPENIFLGDDGKFVLGDFGLARFEGRAAKTKTGLIVGTPAYIAPEQVMQPNENPSPTADLYSLCLVVIEALRGNTGEAKDGMAELSKRLKRVPSLNLIPKPWPNLLRQVLSPRPEERIQSAEAFLTILDSTFNYPVENETRAVNRATSRGRRSLLVGLAVLCLIFGVVTLTHLPSMSFLTTSESDSIEEKVENYLEALEKLESAWPLPEKKLWKEFIRLNGELHRAAVNHENSGRQLRQRGESSQKIVAKSLSLRSFVNAAWRRDDKELWKAAHVAWRQEVKMGIPQSAETIFALENMFSERWWFNQDGTVNEDALCDGHCFFIVLHGKLTSTPAGRKWGRRLLLETGKVMQTVGDIDGVRPFGKVSSVVLSGVPASKRCRQLIAMSKDWAKKNRKIVKDLFHAETSATIFSESGRKGMLERISASYQLSALVFWARYSLLHLIENQSNTEHHLQLLQVSSELYRLRGMVELHKFIVAEQWSPLTKQAQLRRLFTAAMEHLVMRTANEANKKAWAAIEEDCARMVANFCQRIYECDKSKLVTTVDGMTRNLPVDLPMKTYLLSEMHFCLGNYPKVIELTSKTLSLTADETRWQGVWSNRYYFEKRIYPKRWIAMEAGNEQMRAAVIEEARQLRLRLKDQVSGTLKSDMNSLFTAAVIMLASECHRTNKSLESLEGDLNRIENKEFRTDYEGLVRQIRKGVVVPATYLR